MKGANQQKRALELFEQGVLASIDKMPQPAFEEILALEIRGNSNL